MKKRVLAFLLMLVMLVSVLPVNAMAKGGGGGGGGGNTPNESHYNEAHKFGYDSMAENGTVTGATVKVGSTSLSEGIAGSTTGAAVANGVTITFDPGYYLISYKIVCGDKYGCQTAASGNAISKGNVMSGATASSITLDSDDGITKTAFGHTSDEEPYWILLEIGYDNKEYEVSYNWGDLAGKIDTAAPETTKHKVNEVVTVASPASAALGEAYALGYRFVGWKDATDGVSYNGGDQFGMPQRNVELVAQWEKVNEGTVTVNKVWDDNDNEYGLRPDSIEVTLTGTNGYSDTKTVTADESGNWSHTWTGLYTKDINGNTISYSVSEGTVANYSTSVNGYTITNKLETTEITVNKVWNDANNQDGIRPESIQVQLKNGETNVGDPVTLNAENQWKHTWSGLTAGDYKVVEVSVPTGYTSATTGDAATGYTITNTHTPEVTSYTVTKKWADDGDRDGIRPESVSVQLKANGAAYGKPVTVSGTGDSWTYTWSNLPKYSAGTEIAYSAEEVSVPTGSTAAVEGNTITNTQTNFEKTSVTVTKVWDDADNQDGKRPASIQVQLYANGQPSGAAVTVTVTGNTWSYTWNDLFVNKNGEPVKYTVTETNVPEGYESAVTGDAVNGYTITNTHIPATVDVKVTKQWNDDSNIEGFRPESVQVQLKNGENVIGEATLNEDNKWTYTWTGLAKYSNGAEIAYSVDEPAVPEGYDKSIFGSIENGFIISNSNTTDKTSVTVTKKWEDDKNRDGLRPASIQVQLYANETAQGYLVALNDENSWTYTFENLNAYADKKLIVYTVEEIGVPAGYESETTGSADEGYIITNTHDVATTQVKVTKDWQDSGNQDGLRPESITVELYADGVATGNTKELNEVNGWSDSFTDLPVNKAKENASDSTEAIVYTVKETKIPDGYTANDGNAENGYVITNTHTPATTEITVTKEWDDNNNQDGTRPASVEVILLADGEEYANMTIKAAEDGTWTGKFENLPVYKNGKKIVYTVAEVLAEDTTYVPTIDQKTFTITNKDDPDKTSVTVAKAWDDNNDQDGVRPDSVPLTLMANKVKVQDVVLTAKDGWTATISDLDKYYDNGKLIDYTFVEEGEIAEYKYVSTVVDPDTGIITVTNAHETYTIDLTVNKEWDDGDNQDGIRPDSVKVSLYADGELVETVELSKSNKWSYEWNDMDLMAKGEKIVYTVKEEVPAGYTTAAYVELKNGEATIVNTHEPEVWETEITKVWYDNKDASGHRPDSVTVQLYKNGKKYGDKIKLTEKDGWKYAVELPVYEDGKKIEWTVKETNVPKYYDDSYKQETLTVKNTIQTDGSAKTGDMSHIFLWVSLMGISAAAIVAFLAMSKKRTRR